MRIWRSLGVVDLVFSFTSTAFFLVGTFGSQFKISTLADTFGTYLYKQTGHPDALFGCSTPTIIFGLAIAAGVIGTALSLIALFLSVVQLRSPTSPAGLEDLMKSAFTSAVVLDTFLVASYFAHFCETTASLSANGDVDYGFIVSMAILGVLLLWGLLHALRKIAKHTGGPRRAPHQLSLAQRVSYR